MIDSSRYELFEPLGENQYAVVYEAHDFNTDRGVAVMQLKDKFRRDEAHWYQIWGEILERMRLKHEYLVSVHDVDRDRGWIIMELMAGNLGCGEALSPDIVRTVLRRSLEVLKRLHEEGKLHGDIKPRNFVFDREGAVKLSFSPGLMLGEQIPYEDRDFKYVAPEMLNSDLGEVGPALDLYCLGFSALELLKGPQFDALVPGTQDTPEPQTAWMRWHSSPAEKVPPTRELVPGIDENLAGVIDRLVRKSVSERFGSAEEALAALNADAQSDAKVSDETKPDRPPSPSRLPWQEQLHRLWTSYRKPALVSAGVVGVLLFVVVASLLWLSHEPARLAVQFETQPAGAIVTLTADKRRYTPDSRTPFNEELSPGTYEVTFQKPGYAPAQRTLEVRLDGTVEGLDEVVLQPPATKARVALRSHPQEAAVTVRRLEDGEWQRIEGSAATTPVSLTLKPGRYQFAFEKEYYQSADWGPVELRAGEALEAPIIDLEDQSHEVEVHIHPQVKGPVTFSTGSGHRKDVRADFEGDRYVWRIPKRYELEPDRKLWIEVQAAGSTQRAEYSAADLLSRSKVRVAMPERPLTNSLGMEFVRIPAGRYVMGSPLNEAGHKNDEIEREVDIASDFFLSATEVTVAEFRAFLGFTGYQTEAERHGGGRGVLDGNYGKHSSLSWESPGFPNADSSEDHPVVQVTWNDAVKFCEWLSEVEGRKYRLPTEEEWEYACRGGTRTAFSTGSTLRDSNARFLSHEGPLPVGSFEPNSFGLFDMHGNVAEWCLDRYRKPANATKPEHSPSSAASPGPSGKPTGTLHVVTAVSFLPSIRKDYLADVSHTFRFFSSPTLPQASVEQHSIIVDSKEEVLAFLHKLPTGPKDTVFFYYSGRACYEPASGEQYLDLGQSLLWRSDLVTALKGLQARLIILVTETSNMGFRFNARNSRQLSELDRSTIDAQESMVGVTQANASAIASAERAHVSAAYRQLFFETQGFIDLNACKKDQAALPHRDALEGSIFTRMFFKTLRSLERSDPGRVDWHSVIRRTTRATEEAFDTDYPQGVSVADEEGPFEQRDQTPTLMSPLRVTGTRTSDPASEPILRVIRGGGWDDSPAACRSASREAHAPSYRNYKIGFRVLLELEQDSADKNDLSD